MNNDIIKGKWKEIKGKIQQQWGKLTDDDLDQINGSQERLEGMLLKKYGYKKDELKKQLNLFLKSTEKDSIY